MSSDDHDAERRRRRRRRRSGSRRYRHERYPERRPDGEDDIAQHEAIEERRPEVSLRTLIVSVAALIVIVPVVVGGWYYYRSVTSPQARALAEARNLPLVELVMADQPGAEKELRAAVEQDLKQPKGGGISREAALVSELRSAYIAPTLRKADDASLVAAMAARAALVEYLDKKDTKICREFALGGIQHPEKLDEEGQRLFKVVLTAIEGAYRQGRTVQQIPAMPTLQQITDMLYEAGFIKSDFDKLNSFVTLSNDVTCYIVLKLNQVPTKLKPEERGPFSRYILGN